MKKRFSPLIMAFLLAVSCFPFIPLAASADTVLFTTGLESGQTAPNFSDTIDFSSNVSGISSGLSPEASPRSGEQAHTGTSALMYSGNANGGSTTYAYFKVFTVNIPVTSASKLQYYIYPQQDNGRYMAVDFHFTDGSTLRDSGSVDQNGNTVHPAGGHGGTIPLNAWSPINSNFGVQNAGKTIDRIWVAYDRAGSTGNFRGYIDDITISNTTTTSSVRNSVIVSTLYPTSDIVISDYNVTAFGADNTGVNDATAAIQNAIDACYNDGGGTVWLPAGTYKVSGTIQVKAFCSVRGDYRDADSGSGSYGTVIAANLASGDSGPVLFRIGGSASVQGLTVYYPNQNATSPVHYNYTFEIPGNAWIGSENYMTASIMNVTMLNSYRGIGISTMASDHSGGSQVHEQATVKNVKGTILYRGVEAYNGADVGTWEHVNFNSSYWANAGASYNAPSATTIKNWTRTNATAFALGDLEWDQFYAMEASDFNIGINIVTGQRIQFSGAFIWANIQNTNIAVKVDNMDTRWGVSFLRSVLKGSTASVQNNTAGYVKVTDSDLTGATSGTVTISGPGTSPVVSPSAATPKVSRAVLYDVTKAPYNAPFSSSRGPALPTADATSAIQSALNAAGSAGGGVVYVPAGWFKVSTHLTVPANVELRGSASSPTRDQGGSSAGTVLFAYEGKDTTTPDSSTAFITLNGNTAGLRGLRVFYPENNPAAGIKAFPYTIRGNGSSVYIVNVGLPNSYNAIDLMTNRNDNHYVEKVQGTLFKNGITVGLSTSGYITGILTNGNAVCRTGYNIPGWVVESNVFSQVIDAFTRPNETLVTVNGASDEKLVNVFAYGSKNGLVVQSGTVNAFNLGTDNLGSGGYTVKVDSGLVNVMNLMRYNGTTSLGTVTIYNEMHL
ncbi:glycosyl hydrolase family 28-related protein [Paenibacillus sp. BC26]|uniref:glycosyl hydrolase family 28-related protein n=1 Tax=Paenibacillus sp. BC26 TaxID=1881032 RepID=UPI0008E1BA10|nr:glycosyl hydrolase family 28-related protein [Paenibacillus sp. BC26]SFS49040.1 Pectate lyase superfamily protein [Paenibacillus sp. BC26]